MPELSQIQRLIRILQILDGGRKVTTRELRRRFDNAVSLRTLQRDLVALSEAGIPLMTEKTRANENAWFLSRDFRSFIPLPLGTHEYLAAHMLKANLKVFRKTPLEKEIQSLLRKIDQIVQEEVFLEADTKQFNNLFENYSAGLFDYAPHGETIRSLITAIIQRKRCTVTYLSPNEGKEKSFHIEPEKMVYYNGGLYVIVYVRYYQSFIMLAFSGFKNWKHWTNRFPRIIPLTSKPSGKGNSGCSPVNRWPSNCGLTGATGIILRDEPGTHPNR